MGRVSNGTIVALNILSIAVSLCFIALAIYFYVRPHESACQRGLQLPVVAAGAALLVVSAAGLVGSCCRVAWLLRIYLAVLLLLVLVFLAFFVFMIVAAVDKQLGDRSSRWMQRFVDDEKNWNEIKSCLVAVNMCEKIEHSFSPIQPSCCGPPKECGFQSNPGKVSPAGPQDPDCRKWSNRTQHLCLECRSCKRSIVEGTRRQRLLLIFVDFGIFCVVVLIYTVGCSALRHINGKNRRFLYP